MPGSGKEDSTLELNKKIGLPDWKLVQNRSDWRGSDTGVSQLGTVAVMRHRGVPKCMKMFCRNLMAF